MGVLPVKALIAIALVLLALHAIAAHPAVLLALLALELAALAVIGRGCWRASGIGHRRRVRRWVAWTA